MSTPSRRRRVPRLLALSGFSQVALLVMLVVCVRPAVAVDGTWYTQISNTGNTLRSVDFVDESLGWAVGENGTIIHTQDGGVNWSAQTSGTPLRLRTVRFADSSHGWAVGGVGPSDDSAGWGSSASVILWTDNGGDTWHSQSLAGVCLMGGDSVGSDGLVVGILEGPFPDLYLSVMSTSDAGQTWGTTNFNGPSDIGLFSEPVYSVGLASATSGMTGWMYECRRLTNGRYTFPQQLSMPSGLGLALYQSVDYGDAGHVWVGGGQFIGSESTSDYLLLGSSDNGDSWQNQSPAGKGNILGIKAVSPTVVWAVGGSGSSPKGPHIFYTDNRGGSWEAVSTPVDASLWSVDFVGDAAGWAVGQGGAVLHFEHAPRITAPNGGESWEVGTSRQITWEPAGLGHGVAKIELSRDGGANWATLDSSADNDGVYDWEVTGPATTQAKVRVTTLGGVDQSDAVFEITSAPQPTPPVVTYPNGGETWYVGDSQTITWTQGGSGSATVALSRNNGSSWTTLTSSASGNVYTWTVAGPATTLAKVRVTTAEGADASDSVFTISTSSPPPSGGHWRAQSSGTDESLYAVDFVNESQGWAAGGYPDGVILHTANGGETWSTQRTVAGSKLEDVMFPGGGTGYCVGQNGTILRTIDSGVHWTVQTSGVPWWLSGVDFTDLDNGWAVGNGTILHTVNGGQVWTEQDAGFYCWFESVDFVSPSIGWAVGSSGKIIHTINGGQTWTEQASGTTAHLQEVTFVDAAHGRAVGDGDVTVRTADGGATWTAGTGGTSADLNSVAFLDAARGWAVGDSGTIRVTTDTAASWQGQESQTGSDLYGVDFVSATNGWAVGGGGVVLHYVPGPADTVPPQTSAGYEAGWHNHPLTVMFSATDNAGGSGVAKTEYKVDGGAWTTGISVVIDAPATHVNDGTHTVYYRSTDKEGNAEAAKQCEVHVDTRGPMTKALRAVTVGRYGYAKLRYRVNDAQPNDGKATVVIKIKRASGTTVKTFKLGLRPVNKAFTYAFRCKLRKARYQYCVYATDPAGNKQAKVGSKRLVVN
jgi:photosystem II stability/assembly factor-like uncharacterized protein